MKFKSLKIKLTILISLVLIGTVALLTFITFKNVDNRILQPIQNFELSQPAAPSTPTEDLSDVAPVVTSPAEEIQGLNKNFQLSYVYWMIGIALLGILICYYLIQKNLKSLLTLKNSVQDVNEHRLSSRIDLPNKEDEVGQLAHEYNLMLERLEQSFAYQKSFAENAAHELKTPLTTMKLNLQILDLEEKPTLDDYKEHHDISKNSINQLIDIVDQLLLVSNNELLQNIEEISLDLLIMDLVTLNETDAIEKNIELTHQGTPVKIIGNKVLLTQALNNIINNGIKYTPANGAINISYSKTKENIMIKVTDNGIGIDQKDIPFLFEPFYRVDESRTRSLGGSGLGLSLTKKIIDMHHGKIKVTSTLNEGSVFQIILPITSR